MKIDTLTTCEIQFSGKSKWRKAHADFDFKNKGMTVSITTPLGVRNALGTTAVVVGNVDKWTIRAASNGKVSVGIALAGKSLDSNDDAAAFALAEVTTTADTLIEVCLLAEELHIIYKKQTIIVDVTHLTGQTVYPLLSTATTTTATIGTAQNLRIYVDEGGVPCIDSSKLIDAAQSIKLTTGGGGLEVDGDIKITGEFKADGVVVEKPAGIPAQSTGGELVISGPVEQQAGVPDNLRGVAWSPTLKNAILWTVGGSDILYSETGLDFVDNPIAQLENDRPWHVFWANDVYVAVSFSSGELKTSSDGLAWTLQAATGHPYDNTAANRAAIYAFGRIYLSLAAPVQLSVSTDSGVTWSLMPIPTLFVRGLAYDEENGVLVAVGFSGNGPIYTTDGTTWNESTSPITMNRVVYNTELKMFVGVFAEASYLSPDGINWTAYTGQPWTSTPSSFIYAEDTGHMILRPSAGIDDEAYISRNGIDWKKIYLADTQGGYVNYVPFWGMTFYTPRGASGVLTHTSKRFC